MEEDDAGPALAKDERMAKKPQSNLGCILTGIVALLIPIASAVAGGYGTWAFFNTLYPEATEWQPLGSPPAKAIKILSMRDYGYDLVVQTNDGGRYKSICWPRKPASELDCWRKVELSEELPPLKDTTETPHFAAPNPPGRTIDSVIIDLDGEIPEQTNYAILEDGSVWVWYLSFARTRSLDRLGLAILGAVASFGIGTIISVKIGVKAWGGQRATIYLAIGVAILVIMGALFFLRLHSL